MSIITELKFRINLDEDQPLSPVEHTLMAGDQQAHCFMVRCYRGQFRQSVDLTGAQVHGYFIRNEKETIFLEGSIAENVATITLPAACYAQEGSYSLVVKLRLDQVVHTVLWCRGKVLRSSTDDVIDPGQVLPNLDELLAMIDQMEQTTARAESVFNMTAQAYTLPAGSAATASYADGKLTLGIPRGLDSDTALPLGYKPYDMLVIGPDGKPRWEERTHYDYSGGGTVLPLTDLKLIGGFCTFTEPFAVMPEIGMPYRVTCFGYEYNLFAKEWMEDGKRCITLGNQQSIGGTDWTQEPFIFVFYPEGDPLLGTYGYFSCLATNKDTIAVSIEGAGQLKQLDAKYLPQGGGGGGTVFYCTATEGDSNMIILQAYKDQAMTTPLTFNEGYSLLCSGPLMICMTLVGMEEYGPFFMHPLTTRAVSETNVLVCILFIEALISATIVFSDSVLE